MATKKGARFRGLRAVMLWVVGLLLLVLLGLGLKSLLGDAGKPKKHVVQQISLLKPPPPPPPPKPQEKPPEHEIKKEEVKIDQPKPETKEAANQPQEGKQLGVDAEGGAGGDGFGLVGNKGGRDLLVGGGGAAFAFYTNIVQRHLQEELGRNRRLKLTDYRIVVRIWLSRTGVVQKAELATSTGDLEVDEGIRTALLNAGALREPPPENLPQPLKIRITNRGSA